MMHDLEALHIFVSE